MSSLRSFLKGDNKIFVNREFIYKHFPKKFNNYFNPFLGNGNIYFYIKHRNAQLSDADWDLVNAYKQVRHKPCALIDLLSTGDFTRSEARYLDVLNSMRNDDSSDLHRAAKYLYINSVVDYKAYGLYKNWSPILSKGRYVNVTSCNITAIQRCSDFMRRYDPVLTCCDYKIIEEQAKPGDFVFIDPPRFDPIKQTDFSLNDHIELRDYCDRLTKKRVKLMQINSNTDFVLGLYNQYIRVGINHNYTERKNGKMDFLLIKNYV